MRILNIEFKNINSLRDVHRIDFSSGPLSEAGLFAITGPTGSGKSTILDVITLSLFNIVPRLNTKDSSKPVSKSDIAEKGILVTRNCSDAYAQVEYESRGKRYRSKWFIAKNRNDNWNDYEMELSELLDDSTGTILEQKKSKIPDRNEELIGLNYDQFVRSMVLSQGEFSRFLQSSQNERFLLLEQLTGTQIYRRIGIKAFERNKEVRSAIFLRQAELGGIELKDDQWLTEKEAELNTCMKLGIRLATKLKWKKKLLATKTELLGLEDRLVGINRRLSEARQQKSEFTENAEKLKVHDRLNLLNKEFHDIHQLSSDSTKLSSSIVELKHRQEKAEQRKTVLIQSVVSITGEETIESEFSGKINAFRNEIVELDNGIRINTEQLKSIQKTIQDLVKEARIGIPREYLKDEERIAFLKTEFKSLEVKIAGLVVSDDAKKDPELRISQLEKEIKDLEDLIRSSCYLEEKKTEVGLFTKQIDQLTKLLNEESAKIDHGLNQLTLKRDLLQVLKEKQELQKLRASLNEHRANLKKGEPCPLCGALEHPDAANIVVDDSLKKQIGSEQMQLELLEKELTLFMAKKNGADGEKRSLEAQLKKLEELIAQETLRNISIRNEAGILPELPLANFEEFLERKRQEILDLKTYSKAVSDHITISRLLTMFQDRKEADQKLMELMNSRADRYSGENINEQVSSWDREFSEIKTTIENCSTLIASQQLELLTKSEQLHLSTKDLEEKLKKEGFQDLDDARNKFLEPSKAEELRKKQQQLDHEETSILGSLKILLAQKEQLVQKDNSRIPFGNLKENIESIEEQENELKIFQGALTNELKSHKENRVRFNKLQKEIESMEKDAWKWQMIADLIGDAQGNTFCRIVQRLTLKQLFMHANARLSQLNDRYLLVSNDESKEDIEIVDRYFGNMRRTVKSLSGGEIFLVSLSLALGLSDLASQNVKLDSLFIDEGFGTLDPETLDTAISTLEKLQAESDKSIGIISHVESLKERIGCQIRLSKSGNGFSSMAIGWTKS